MGTLPSDERTVPYIVPSPVAVSFTLSLEALTATGVSISIVSAPARERVAMTSVFRPALIVIGFLKYPRFSPEAFLPKISIWCLPALSYNFV